MKKLLMNAAAITILSAATGLASAEDYGHDEAKSWDKNAAKSWDKKGMEKKMMMGRHAMSGTIEVIDLKTGWIKLKTSEGEMTVHFPAQSIKDLKNGDIITVHLSFSKGEEMMDDKMKK